MRRLSAITPLVNAALAPLARGRRHPDRVFERLVDDALAASGGSLDGEESFVEDFRLLLGDFAAVDRLTPIGWLSATGDLRARLENRLRIRRLHRERSELADEPIERPIVIVGLPRTATTLTHNVIARSEGNRAPRLWEWAHTDLGKTPDAEAPIIRGVERGVGAALRLAPGFRAIHPQDARKPDECPFLLPHGFQHLARAPMRDYERRLDGRDFGPDYDYLKQALQVLQHGRRRRRWILKSPTHLDNLEELVRIFPDCSILWLHRDPVAVVGSICSLVETGMLLHVRRPDLDYIGRMCLRLTARLIERGRAARDRISPERLIDAHYDWLVADTAATMPVLHELLDSKWSRREEAALASIVRRPSRRAHDYDHARYGLDTEQIQAVFGDYVEYARSPQPPVMESRAPRPGA